MCNRSAAIQNTVYFRNYGPKRLVSGHDRKLHPPISHSFHTEAEFTFLFLPGEVDSCFWTFQQLVNNTHKLSFEKLRPSSTDKL